MNFTLLDGGMGQELMARSKVKPTGLWATKTLMDMPELIEAVHADYFTAGADVATTNSYAIHRDRLIPFDIEDQFVDLHVQACEIASRARDKHGSGLIAGSAGPTGASYRPELSLEVEQGAEVYAEVARIQEPFVDVILLETLASVKQAAGAVMGASSVGKPVWLSVSVDDDDGSKLRSGENLTDVLPLLDQGADALLINCSIPEAVNTAMAIVSQPLAAQSIPFGAYANGFTKISDAFKQDGSTVDSLESRKDLDPAAYQGFAETWHGHGARIIGGCCEVGPAHISALAQRFK
ncbi:MAG: homocysteine S-methyltransferase family protein [Pseudomonadota bacterium]